MEKIRWKYLIKKGLKNKLAESGCLKFDKRNIGSNKKKK